MAAARDIADVLTVANLRVRYPTAGVPAVDDVSFALSPGKTLALVGDSGSGKTSIALTLLGLHPRRPAPEVSGTVQLRAGGEVVDLLSLTDEAWRRVRRRHLAMVFQDPAAALNPMLRISVQLREAGATGARAVQLLERVGIEDVTRVLRAYPHELSGGMQQRALLAMAVARDPLVLVADEPSSALDVTVQAQVLRLMRALQQAMGMAMLLITHDMGVVAEAADEVAVLERGCIVERGSAPAILAEPKSAAGQRLVRAARTIHAGGRSS